MAAMRAQPLKRTCDESWVPNRRTFEGADWRRDAARAGPVTFLSVRPLERYQFSEGSTTTLKIRLLVRPRTPVSISLDASVADAVGFVRFGGDEAPSVGPDAKTELELEGCPGTPANKRAIRDLADIGYPSLWRMSRPLCVPVRIESPGEPSVTATLGLGTQDC